jgi:hypothetical protein
MKPSPSIERHLIRKQVLVGGAFPPIQDYRGGSVMPQQPINAPAHAATGESPMGVLQAQAEAAPAQSMSANGEVAQGEPGAPQHRLQDVLPEIKDLAQKVGGFKRLADIAADLAEPKD